MTTVSGCNLCGASARAQTKAETARVRCNVREFADETFTVWRCTKCRSLHCSEPIDHAAYYRDYPIARIKLDLAMRLAYRNRRKLLERCGIGRDDAILDFGCGTGLFVQTLREAGYRQAVGYDAFVPENADEGVLTHKFDVVTAQDVIEHDEEPRALLGKLAGLLNPGGFLAIGIPDADHIDLNDVETHLMSLHQPYHRHIPSKECLIGMGTDLGLEVVDTYERFYFDTPVPGLNTRFMTSFIRAQGNLIDVAFGKPQLSVRLLKPALVRDAFLGYLMPREGGLIVTFKAPGSRRLRRQGATSLS